MDDFDFILKTYSLDFRFNRIAHGMTSRRNASGSAAEHDV
jgi:hypothetical protein